MNSNVFNNTLKESSSRRKKLSKRPEIEDVISYKGNQSFRDNIEIKDPQKSLILKKDLGQSKVLAGNAEVFKQREILSSVFS